MKQDPILRHAVQEPESLAGDFGLIFEAFADAFRGMSSSLRESRCCPKLHFAGWR